MSIFSFKRNYVFFCDHQIIPVIELFALWKSIAACLRALRLKPLRGGTETRKYGSGTSLWGARKPGPHLKTSEGCFCALGTEGLGFGSWQCALLVALARERIICAPIPLREDGENTTWSRCLTRCRHLMNTFPLNEKRINERMHARFSEVTCKVRAKS